MRRYLWFLTHRGNLCSLVKYGLKPTRGLAAWQQLVQQPPFSWLKGACLCHLITLLLIRKLIIIHLSPAGCKSPQCSLTLLLPCHEVLHLFLKACNYFFYPLTICLCLGGTFGTKSEIHQKGAWKYSSLRSEPDFAKSEKKKKANSRDLPFSWLFLSSSKTYIWLNIGETTGDCNYYTATGYKRCTIL